MVTSAAAPVSTRNDSIDSLRGFAVLGILLVNCAYFALPMTQAGELAGRGERELIDVLAWGFVKGFAELKFVTLFSFLFGIGFAMQLERATQGSGFYKRYAKRLGVLALFGLLHGVFLFMGDILLCYAFCGAALLVTAKLPARGLLALGLLIVIAMVPWITGLTLLDAVERVEAVETAEVVELAAGAISPAEALEAPWSMDSARLAAVETRVFGEGPWLTSTALRASEFTLFLAVCLLYFGWRALGYFCIGAALFRLGLFSEGGRKWRVRMRNVGLGIGLPLTLFAVLLAMNSSDERAAGGQALAAGLVEIASFFLPAGYAGALLLWSESARGALARGLAAVGRMALTNYIGQSLIMSFVVCHWGLGLYGELELPVLLALSVAIFATQLILSSLWLARFNMGPLEWLWRWATYGSRPAFRR